MTLAEGVHLGGGVRHLQAAEADEGLQQLDGVGISRLAGNDEHPVCGPRRLPDELGRDGSTYLGAVRSGRSHPLENLVGDSYSRHLEVEVLGVFEVANRCDAEQYWDLTSALAKSRHESLELLQREQWISHEEVHPCLEFLQRTIELEVAVGGGRVDSRADDERRGCSSTRSPLVRGLVQTKQCLNEVDRAHLEDSAEVGVVALWRRYARCTHHASQPECVRSEKVGLQSEKALLPGRGTEHDIDTEAISPISFGLLLQERLGV